MAGENGSVAATPTRPHTATARTHSTTHSRRLIRQCHASLFGARLHLLMKLLADLLSLLSRLRRAHFGAMVGSFLGRHKLATVDLFLLLRLSLFFGGLRVSG